MRAEVSARRTTPAAPRPSHHTRRSEHARSPSVPSCQWTWPACPRKLQPAHSISVHKHRRSSCTRAGLTHTHPRRVDTRLGQGTVQRSRLIDRENTPVHAGHGSGSDVPHPRNRQHDVDRKQNNGQSHLGAHPLILHPQSRQRRQAGRNMCLKIHRRGHAQRLRLPGRLQY